MAICVGVLTLLTLLGLFAVVVTSGSGVVETVEMVVSLAAGRVDAVGTPAVLVLTAL